MPVLAQDGSEHAIQITADGRIDLIWGTDGNPVFGDTQEFRVTALLLERLGEWAFDETGKRGSRLHTIKDDRRQLTVSQLRGYAAEALRPAVEGKYIRDLKIDAKNPSRRKYFLYVSWVAGGVRIPRRYEFEV